MFEKGCPKKMSEKGCESILYNQTASDNMCWQFFWNAIFDKRNMYVIMGHIRSE